MSLNKTSFYKQPFGFRKKSQYNPCTINTCNKVTESITNKKPTLGIFLDLSKAFDTIDHNVLLAKLRHNLIRGIALEWFRS